jgi:hypothetical protein
MRANRILRARRLAGHIELCRALHEADASPAARIRRLPRTRGASASKSSWSASGPDDAGDRLPPQRWLSFGASASIDRSAEARARQLTHYFSPA